eukprot:GHVR01132862.1.p1 GENE.GHVR01132862.1~~GHVR01132862.1.p1  ORF type:complete len:303 (+),score=89.24 GHVR01132862.1:54-962(+)
MKGLITRQAPPSCRFGGLRQQTVYAGAHLPPPAPLSPRCKETPLVAALRAQVDHDRRELVELREKHNELESKYNKIKDLRSAAFASEEALKEYQSSLVSREAYTSELEERLHMSDTQRKEAESRLTTVEGDVKVLQEKLQGALEANSQLQINIQTLLNNSFIVGHESRLSAEKDLKDAKKELQEKSKLIKEFEILVERLEKEKCEIQDQLREVRLEEKDAVKEAAKAQQRVEFLSQQIADLKGQLDIVRDTLSERDRSMLEDALGGCVCVCMCLCVCVYVCVCVDTYINTYEKYIIYTYMFL